MFEKEADLHASIMAWDEDVDTWEDIAERSFQKGAEFGYNKANEWHYVKDKDLPKATTPVLVILESGVPYVSWISSDKGWWFCTNYYTGEDKVIAWKEIVLPELKEGE